jgi:hypothetical protein
VVLEALLPQPSRPKAVTTTTANARFMRR